jgi:hypothetical protein
LYSFTEFSAKLIFLLGAIGVIHGKLLIAVAERLRKQSTTNHFRQDIKKAK